MTWDDVLCVKVYSSLWVYLTVLKLNQDWLSGSLLLMEKGPLAGHSRVNTCPFLHTLCHNGLIGSIGALGDCKCRVGRKEKGAKGPNVHNWLRGGDDKGTMEFMIGFFSSDFFFEKKEKKGREITYTIMVGDDKGNVRFINLSDFLSGLLLRLFTWPICRWDRSCRWVGLLWFWCCVELRPLPLPRCGLCVDVSPVPWLLLVVALLLLAVRLLP